MKRLIPMLALIPLLVVAAASAPAEETMLLIKADEPAAKVSPTLYGLMTEEISHSYDGGLYAELIRNRAFLDNPQSPANWSAVGGATLSLERENGANSALPVSLRVEAASASETAPAGVANSGYWGIPVKPRTRYRASFYAKAAGGFSGPITLAIQSPDGGTVFARSTVRRVSGDWQQYTATLKTGDVTPTTKARFTLSMNRPGTVSLSLVSLFPPTWKDQANGFRPDLLQMLADLKPAFLRFPGGNYLEGNTIAQRFDWKKTLGPLKDRPGHQGPWGYRSTDGMGLLEFLRWCEAMDAEPVLAVFAGYALGGEHVEAGPNLQPYVQDALDEIEYVSGSTSTTWGARRAKDGHQKPFPLRYVEVGNEDFFDRSGSYDGRFAQFYDAIKAKYPDLQVISTVGNEQPAAKRVKSRRPDLLDEHYYASVARFLQMSPDHYEKYDRKGPAIFVGEWGAYEDIEPWNPRSRGLPPTPNMKAALGDAVWMADMERNSDLIKMHCYAPLLVNVNPGASQWRPNLIGYDALRSYGSPSYYAFRMFSRNVGDAILKTAISGSPLHVSVTQDTGSGTIFVKAVNPQPAPQTVRIDLQGVSSVGSRASVTVLSADPSDTNSIDQPEKVVPATHRIPGASPHFSYTFAPNSVSVLRLETR